LSIVRARVTRTADAVSEEALMPPVVMGTLPLVWLGVLLLVLGVGVGVLPLVEAVEVGEGEGEGDEVEEEVVVAEVGEEVVPELPQAVSVS